MYCTGAVPSHVVELNESRTSFITESPWTNAAADASLPIYVRSSEHSEPATVSRFLLYRIEIPRQRSPFWDIWLVVAITAIFGTCQPPGASFRRSLLYLLTGSPVDPITPSWHIHWSMNGELLRDTKVGQLSVNTTKQHIHSSVRCHRLRYPCTVVAVPIKDLLALTYVVLRSAVSYIAALPSIVQ